MPNQEQEHENEQPIINTKCYFVIFGTSGSGKTSFLNYYLDQTNSDFLVFICDQNEFGDDFL